MTFPVEDLRRLLRDAKPAYRWIYRTYDPRLKMQGRAKVTQFEDYVARVRARLGKKAS